jgi:PadR family transcriptional regulator PadR
MWLRKFLDLKEDIDTMTSEMKKRIKKDRLTPLEFTILETIFNSNAISGYDLIQNLNRIFAGTWKAHSGTVYPILSKLKNDGFLRSKTFKSPIGPLKKLYSLTEAGEKLIKLKVNKNYLDQINCIENFLIELSSVFIQSFPDEEKDEKIKAVYQVLKNSFENVIENIPPTLRFNTLCPECKSQIKRSNASFCPHCGCSLSLEQGEEKI